VSVATRYGMDGPGIESQWEPNIPHPSMLDLGPSRSLLQWLPGILPGAKLPGRGINHPPHLEPRLKMEYSYTSTRLCATMDCSMVIVTFHNLLEIIFFICYPVPRVPLSSSNINLSETIYVFCEIGTAILCVIVTNIISTLSPIKIHEEQRAKRM
jgi:hypothetical protein